jgi:hypothetical protein
MVSRVMCKEHGMQNGALACDHVQEAVWNKAPVLVRCREVVQDFMGDGTLLLPSLLCPQCIAAFGIDLDKILPAEADEQSGKFPHVAPVCTQCLREYQKVQIT